MEITLAHNGEHRLILMVNHDGTVQMVTCDECCQSMDAIGVLARTINKITEYPQGGDLLGPIPTEGGV
jgi:hypothetical protein